MLDAVASGDLLAGTLVGARWQEIKDRVGVGENYESEALLLHDLLDSLEASGGLAGTWIEERWRAIRSRGTGVN